MSSFSYLCQNPKTQLIQRGKMLKIGFIEEKELEKSIWQTKVENENNTIVNINLSKTLINLLKDKLNINFDSPICTITENSRRDADSKA